MENEFKQLCKVWSDNDYEELAGATNEQNYYSCICSITISMVMKIVLMM